MKILKKQKTKNKVITIKYWDEFKSIKTRIINKIKAKKNVIIKEAKKDLKKVLFIINTKIVEKKKL